MGFTGDHGVDSGYFFYEDFDSLLLSDTSYSGNNFTIDDFGENGSVEYSIDRGNYIHFDDGSGKMNFTFTTENSLYLTSILIEMEIHEIDSDDKQLDIDVDTAGSTDVLRFRIYFNATHVFVYARDDSGETLLWSSTDYDNTTLFNDEWFKIGFKLMSTTTIRYIFSMEDVFETVELTGFSGVSSTGFKYINITSDGITGSNDLNFSLYYVGGSLSNTYYDTVIRNDQGVMHELGSEFSTSHVDWPDVGFDYQWQGGIAHNNFGYTNGLYFTSSDYGSPYDFTGTMRTFHLLVRCRWGSTGGGVQPIEIEDFIYANFRFYLDFPGYTTELVYQNPTVCLVDGTVEDFGSYRTGIFELAWADLLDENGDEINNTQGSSYEFYVYMPGQSGSEYKYFFAIGPSTDYDNCPHTGDPYRYYYDDVTDFPEFESSSEEISTASGEKDVFYYITWDSLGGGSQNRPNIYTIDVTEDLTITQGDEIEVAWSQTFTPAQPELYVLAIYKDGVYMDGSAEVIGPGYIGVDYLELKHSFGYGTFRVYIHDFGTGGGIDNPNAEFDEITVVQYAPAGDYFIGELLGNNFETDEEVTFEYNFTNGNTGKFRLYLHNTYTGANSIRYTSPVLTGTGSPKHYTFYFPEVFYDSCQWWWGLYNTSDMTVGNEEDHDEFCVSYTGSPANPYVTIQFDPVTVGNWQFIEWFNMPDETFCQILVEGEQYPVDSYWGINANGHIGENGEWNYQCSFVGNNTVRCIRFVDGEMVVIDEKTWLVNSDGNQGGQNIPGDDGFITSFEVNVLMGFVLSVLIGTVFFMVTQSAHLFFGGMVSGLVIFSNPLMGHFYLLPAELGGIIIGGLLLIGVIVWLVS